VFLRPVAAMVLRRMAPASPAGNRDGVAVEPPRLPDNRWRAAEALLPDAASQRFPFIGFDERAAGRSDSTARQGAGADLGKANRPHIEPWPHDNS
jgi:hypothetical protein